MSTTDKSTIEPPSGQPFAVVGSAEARKLIRYARHNARAMDAFEMTPTPKLHEERAQALFDVVAHRDFLHAKVTKDQKSSTACVQRARAAEELIAKVRAAAEKVAAPRTAHDEDCAHRGCPDPKSCASGGTRCEEPEAICNCNAADLDALLEIARGRAPTFEVFQGIESIASEPEPDSETEPSSPLWAFVVADDTGVVLLEHDARLDDILAGSPAGDYFSTPAPGVWFWEGVAVWSPSGEYGLETDLEFDGEWRKATVKQAMTSVAPEAEQPSPTDAATKAAPSRSARLACSEDEEDDGAEGCRERADWPKCEGCCAPIDVEQREHAVDDEGCYTCAKCMALLAEDTAAKAAALAGGAS